MKKEIKRRLLLGEKVTFHKDGKLGTVISSNLEKWNKIGTESPTWKNEYGTECGVSCCILWEDNDLRDNPFNCKKGPNISISIPQTVYKYEKQFNIVNPVNFDKPEINKELKTYNMSEIYEQYEKENTIFNKVKKLFKNENKDEV